MNFQRHLRSLLVAFALASCGGGGSGGSSSTPAGTADPVATATPTTTPTATATPTPTPTPSPTATTAGMPMPVPSGTAVATPTLAGLAKVASGVDVDSHLQPSWGTGEIPASAAPDVVGAFRFLCAPSHNAYDDPVVYPGQPGKAHLHTFFGNTKTDANSTYQSLRTTGDSTCNNLLNRSAYWVPAMMNGRGKVVMPDYVAIYYKRMPESSKSCQDMGKACVPLPRGLRYVFGYNMSNPAKSTSFYFNCDGAGAVPGHYKNIPQAAKNCPAGARLGAVLSAPYCWNGTELDSPDHRSHLASPSYGTWGYLKCPSSHPYILPELQVGVWYTTDETLDRSGSEAVDLQTWHFSSDRMAGMTAMVPGTTYHADWFGAWEDSVLDMWNGGCINKLLNCSGGDLGNGKQMKLEHGYKYGNRTVLVDPPAKPST